jgi:hypothetical protein
MVQSEEAGLLLVEYPRRQTQTTNRGSVRIVVVFGDLDRHSLGGQTGMGFNSVEFYFSIYLVVGSSIRFQVDQQSRSISSREGAKLNTDWAITLNTLSHAR